MERNDLSLLENIPDYQVFLTADELDDSSRRLAEKYPDVASVFQIGVTKNGTPLLCLKIEGGADNALMFGCPHPNEPIGTMMLEYFSEQLAADKSLRDRLGYTWYIVKAWDRDGLELNEGWLKGPYTIENYSRHFFRPAGHRQVDWTFPIQYKDVNFNAPVPETEAMMRLIDEIRPHFIYSLHNAGFGGTYWYLSGPLPDTVYRALHEASARVDIPLNLGEPEVPYITPLADAIYPALGLAAEYDYLEQYGETDIAEKITCGTCSEEYASKRYGSFTLITELPYFYDARIMDQSPGDRTRREAVTERLEFSEAGDRYIKGVLEQTKDIIDPENPFRLALEAFSKGTGNDSTRKMIETNPDYQRQATVAEVFDNTIMSQFYKCLSYGMTIRLAEYALEHETDLAETDKDVLNSVKDLALEEHKKLCAHLEAELNYEVVPIRKLVSIQLESGLAVCEALKQKKKTP